MFPQLHLHAVTICLLILWGQIISCSRHGQCNFRDVPTWWIHLQSIEHNPFWKKSYRLDQKSLYQYLRNFFIKTSFEAGHTTTVVDGSVIWWAYKGYNVQQLDGNRTFTFSCTDANKDVSVETTCLGSLIISTTVQKCKNKIPFLLNCHNLSSLHD